MTELDGSLFCMFNFQPVKDNKYSSYLELDLNTVEPCISGPKRYKCVPDFMVPKITMAFGKSNQNIEIVYASQGFQAYLVILLDNF